MPKTIMKNSGASSANSTAEAPRSERTHRLIQFEKGIRFSIVVI
jgi:hypothetical protein